MAKTTTTIEVRIVDYAPVATVLSAAGDLAKAVDAYLNTIEGPFASARPLERALRDFKAAVMAQADEER